MYHTPYSGSPSRTSTYVPSRSYPAADRAVAEVFRNAESPAMTRTDTIRYGSDGIEAPVSQPRGWQSGRYVTYSEYISRDRPDEKVHYNISGTGPNGEYIPPHRVFADGTIAYGTGAPQSFRIREESRMIQLLDLQQASQRDENGRVYFTRPGFVGRYYLQTEDDGQVSVFYAGGRHSSGVSLPPQTFVNGSWDLQRRARRTEGEVVRLPSRYSRA